ncbi:uncharacterized protein LOC113299463 isoform X2 [Papaver somniferum]|uniref:uncharacterized protein LOC113299463 isoform X2 n=1 Tax=Papaver somniferum TaxID=3469 RepID=UPI000E7052FB|nr:uncharacterized protein LOC113299463 isoform X2 [Papaver somniferum]
MGQPADNSKFVCPLDSSSSSPVLRSNSFAPLMSMSTHSQTSKATTQNIAEMEEEIEAKVNFHIQFNKNLGIDCNHPNMREICKSLIQRNSANPSNMELPAYADNDGLGSYDSEDKEQLDEVDVEEGRIDAINDLGGASGGIIVMWKQGFLHMEDHLVGAFSLSIRQCWQELSNIRILFEDPWVLGGDFNAILSQSERNKSGGCITNRRFFKKFVSRHELMDLPVAGDFLPNLKVWWQNLTFTGRPSFVFVKKLQGLKFFIKAWRKTFGDLQLKIDHLEDVINSWDLQEEADIVLSTAEVVAREEAKAKHAALTLDVARKWGQRAKEDWARNAEKNSKYLHQISDNFDEGCKC